jgi:hypothetical protein
MGKGKGHQSGSFGRKSQGAAFRHEFQEQVSQVRLNRAGDNEIYFYSKRKTPFGVSGTTQGID